MLGIARRAQAHTTAAKESYKDEEAISRATKKPIGTNTKYLHVELFFSAPRPLLDFFPPPLFPSVYFSCVHPPPFSLSLQL